VGNKDDIQWAGSGSVADGSSVNTTDQALVIAALDRVVAKALQRVDRGEVPIILRPYMEPRPSGVMRSSSGGIDTEILTRRCFDDEIVSVDAVALAARAIASNAGSRWVDELADRKPESYFGSSATEALVGLATEIVEACVAGSRQAAATEAALARFDRFCGMGSIRWIVRVGLTGVSVVDGLHSLSGDLVIRTADDEFKRSLWAAHGPGGSHFTTFADDDAMAVSGLGAVLEATREIERDEWPSLPDVSDDVALALTALRVHGGRRLSCLMRWLTGPPEIRGFTRSPSSSMSMLPNRPSMWRPPASALTIDGALGSQLKEWIERLNDRPVDDPLAFAIQRFNLCDERAFDDDRLVDSWIALESLLSKSDEGGDLSYRVALRLATLLGDSPADRQAIRGLAKRSYALRSKVVHGIPPEKRTKKLQAGDLASETEDLLRKTLRLWVWNRYEGPKQVIEKLETDVLD
jgi:hypothetical protein